MRSRRSLRQPPVVGRRWQPVRCRYFIDESGQFFPGRRAEHLGPYPGPWDLGVLVALVAPEERQVEAEIRELVEDLRKKYQKGKSLKAKDIPEDAKLSLAREIVRRDWHLAEAPVELAEGLQDGVVEAFRDLVLETRPKLRNEAVLGPRLDDLVHRFEKLSLDQVAWFMALHSLLGRICQAARLNGQVPSGSSGWTRNSLPTDATWPSSWFASGS